METLLPLAHCSPPVLEARGVARSFGHIEALREVNFVARAGEITALIGDNGAGKSTLVKILSGVLTASRGTIYMGGEEIVLSSPMMARRCGIETVFQDLSIAPDLTPAENMFIGRELLRPGFLGRFGFLDRAKMKRESAEAFERLNVTPKDMDSAVVTLSGGQRQSVAICRSAMWASKVVFMDEPTAALGVLQTKRTLDLLKRIRDTGIAVVLISHNMRDVIEVADVVEVLRLGRTVARLSNDKLTVQDLVGAMTGALDVAAN
jgi:simple sugar transport system ATP-binding protein